ncbi:MAG: right-handed parallel beta-helix repeat-containing protein [Phycisphaerales bacterium]
MKRIIILTFLAANVFAADRTWDGGGADDNWTTAANWTGDVVPLSGERVYLDESSGTIIVPTGQTVSPTKIIGPCNTAIGTTTMTINGELYNSSYWYMGRNISGQGVLNVPGYVKTRDLFVAPGNGYSGTVNVNGGELWVYGDGNSIGAFFGSNCTDGVNTITTTGTAAINVVSGILRINRLHTIGVNAYINITYGTMLLSGDKTSLVSSLITSNQIRAFGGTGFVQFDYNTLNPGYTTVYAFSGLHEMFDEAAEGSTVYVPDGVYYEGQFDIDKSLTVMSQNGPENVIVNMTGNGIGITDSGVIIDGFTITTDSAAVLLNVGKSVSGATIDVNNCTIQNCIFDGDGLADGIYVSDCNDVNFYSNRITDCPNGVIVSSSALNLSIVDNDIFSNACGVRVLGAVDQINLISNGIYWNTSYGVVNAGGGTLNAENNYWGSENGPYHSTLNPSGSGNAVSNGVDFDPYFTGCNDDRWHICPEGDINADCKIDYKDLAIIAENWLVCSGPDCP